MTVEQKSHRKGPGPDDIGAKIALRNASDLPEGAWVSSRTGHLYEAEDGQSLTAVITDDQQEFVLVGSPGRTSYPVMRQRAREHGIEPSF